MAVPQPARRGPFGSAAAAGASGLMATQLRTWLDALADIARAVTEAPPLDDLLRMIARTTRHLTGYDSCAILLQDETRQVLVIRGSSGLSDSYVEELNERNPLVLRPGEPGDGPSSRAYRTRRPVALVDVLSDPSCGPWEPVITEQGVRSLLCVPLVSSGAPLGVLNCYTTTRHAFSAQEVILMETIANQIAIAIEQAKLRAQEQARIAELLQLNEQLEARRVAMERAEALHHDLMRILLEGEGPEAITRALAQALRCVVVLQDDAGRRLAASDPAGRRPEGPATDLLAVAAPPEFDAGERRAVEVPPDPAAGVTHPGMVSPVILDRELAGHVWALDPAEPFGPVDLRSLERGVVLIALALSGDRRAQEIEWRLSRDVLDDLFSQTRDIDLAALATRARHLGVELDAPHTVLVARPDPPRERPGDGARVLAHVHRSFLNQVQRVVDAASPKALVASRADHVVVLWPERDGQCEGAAVATAIHREVRHYTQVDSVSVAVGERCQGAGAYADAYRGAVAALDLAQAAGQRDRVVRLQELGLHRLLLQVRDPRQVLDFASRTLAPLRAHDAAHDAQLAATLKAYLESGCSTSETAARLVVHPNTVTYRLRRIAELLAADPRDPQVMLELSFAFAVERVLDSPGAGG